MTLVLKELGTTLELTGLGTTLVLTELAWVQGPGQEQALSRIMME